MGVISTPGPSQEGGSILVLLRRDFNPALPAAGKLEGGGTPS